MYDKTWVNLKDTIQHWHTQAAAAAAAVAVATSEDEAVDKTHPPGIPYKYCGITRFVQTYTRDKPDILCVFTHWRMRISSGRQTTLGHQYVVIKYYSGASVRLVPEGLTLCFRCVRTP